MAEFRLGTEARMKTVKGDFQRVLWGMGHPFPLIYRAEDEAPGGRRDGALGAPLDAQQGIALPTDGTEYEMCSTPLGEGCCVGLL
jgi:hypothetical protein